MPRRANHAVAYQDLSSPQPDLQLESLANLRTQWRWAAFSQFFFTFSPLFAMNDVSLADIERDLICDTKQVFPRIMQRLLYTLSYDRKVSVDNWQTALRKQYNKRDPFANPIGPDPSTNSRNEENDHDSSEENKAEHMDTFIHKYDARSQETSALTTPSSIEVIPSNSTRHSSVSEDRHALEPASDIKGKGIQQWSIDWFDLPMLAKLESLHTLAEWHFQNPTRLRMIMKSDDDFATWRIEPIGYDSKRNAYWLIGANRLWTQRAPPKPPRPKRVKRKPDLQKSSEKKKTYKNSIVNRQNSTPDRPFPSRLPLVASSGLRSRVAKDQAKRRLDAQAKELAELNKQATLATSKSRTERRATFRMNDKSRVVGTRASARLRGTLADDEWQPIPDDWLDDVRLPSSKRSECQKTGLESGDGSVSDLTDLSEDSLDPVSIKDEVHGEEKEKDGSGECVDDEIEVDDAPEQWLAADNFVEWQTICVTLYEWENIARQFEKATHYSEKALYNVLVKDIVPVVTQELREQERKQQLEEAIVHRKRSSRIAVRESEREEVRAAARRKQEEDEKMSRARRLEVRRQREEEERLKKEHAREQRRKEREERDMVRKAQLAAEAQVETISKKRKSSSPARDSRRAKAPKAVNKDSNSGSHTPVGEDWELACEICHHQGINLDDGTPMVSCGICSRWQHIQCHDRADRAAGHPRRIWKFEEFICSQCRASQRVQYNNNLSSSTKQALSIPITKQSPSTYAPQVQCYGASQPVMPTIIGAGHPPNCPSESHYLSGHRDSAQPNSPMKSNGHQSLNTQYSSGSSTPLSFSHYQPAQHSFLTAAPQKTPYSNVQPPHGRYNSSHSPQRHRQEPSSNHDTQSTTPSWNIDTPTHHPTSLHPNRSVALTNPLLYRHSPSDVRDQPVFPSSNNEPSQTSYTRHSADHYSSVPYKRPVFYQHTLGQ